MFIKTVGEYDLIHINPSLDPKSLLDNNNFSIGSNWLQEIQKQKISGQWVVIGGPGQGKTTIGQFLCQLFRVAILKDRTNINTNIEVQRAISNFESQSQQETIALPTQQFCAAKVSDPTPQRDLSD